MKGTLINEFKLQNGPYQRFQSPNETQPYCFVKTL